MDNRSPSCPTRLHVMFVRIRCMAMVEQSLREPWRPLEEVKQELQHFLHLASDPSKKWASRDYRFTMVKEFPVPIEQEVSWAPEVAWTL